MDYRYEAPPILRDYLIYHETIKGHSRATVDEYFLDLRNFFRFLKIERGLVPRAAELSEVSILDVDLDFVSRVTLAEVYDYLAFLSRDKAKFTRARSEEFGLNAASRARKVSSIRGFYKYLTTKAKLLDENPLQDLDSPRSKRSLPRYLTLEESERLLNSVDGMHKERDFCILTIFLNCGLRISEIAGMNLSDIRSDHIRVLGKGNKERVVYLNDATAQAINDYLIVRRDPFQPPHAHYPRSAARRGEEISPACRSGRRQVFRTQAAPYGGNADALERCGRAYIAGASGP